MKRTLPLLILLAACNREPQPEPPSVAENTQLDEADAMLNEFASKDANRH